jgi:Flp pilus assembly protein TadD
MYAKVYNDIGTSYADLGDYDQALKALADALKYQPESVEFRNNYAFTLTLRGDTEAAVKEYRDVLRSSPGNAHAMEMLQEISKKKSSEATK